MSQDDPDIVRLTRHASDIDDDGHDIYAGAGTDDQTAAEVPFTPAAGIAATDVQAAIEEDAGDLAAHLADTSDAHDASAVSIADAGSYYSATDVEAALQELAKKDIGYQAHGAIGATETFSALTGWHSATLDANCTFTLSGATSGLAASMVLELAQDGTGGWLMTLPASVVNRVALEADQDLTASTTTLLLLMSRDGGGTWYGFWAGGSGSSVGALDDLSDVTITTPAEDDQLQYVGGGWVNNARRWEPVTTNPGTGPEIVWDGDDIVMTWRAY